MSNDEMERAHWEDMRLDHRLRLAERALGDLLPLTEEAPKFHELVRSNLKLIREERDRIVRRWD